MLAVVPWQWLLDGLGWVLARIYDFVPSYGVAIVVLTLLIKVVLFPFQWKQIRSMQHMQALQPKLKELQKKYKNNKQKQQEEQMRLYREAGVNPLGGCLPMLLMYPFLIAMYSVIGRGLVLEPATGANVGSYHVAAGQSHIPTDSALFHALITHDTGGFLGMDLQCTLLEAGSQVPQFSVDPTQKDRTKQQQPLPDGKPILDRSQQPLPVPATTAAHLDCGTKRFPDVVPYALLVLLMVASGFFMQRQTMRATPASAQTGSQQALMKYMPLMFGFFGLRFSAGLVLYWTVSNGFQMAQQTFMLRAGHIGPEAIEKRMTEQRQRADSGAAPRETFMTRLSKRAEDAQKQREQRQKSGGSGAGAAGGQRRDTPASGGSKKQPPGGKPKGGGARPGKGAPPGRQLKKKKPDGGDSR